MGISSANALTPAESRNFDRCKKTIKSGLRTFVEVGQALTEIKDREYYLTTHTSFPDFCRDEFDVGKAYAYRLIAAAEIQAAISHQCGGNPKSTIVDCLPVNEAQSAPLAKLPIEEVADCWTEVVDSRLGSIVFAVVDQLVFCWFSESVPNPCIEIGQCFQHMFSRQAFRDRFRHPRTDRQLRLAMTHPHQK